MILIFSVTKETFNSEQSTRHALPDTSEKTPKDLPHYTEQWPSPPRSRSWLKNSPRSIRTRSRSSHKKVPTRSAIKGKNNQKNADDWQNNNGNNVNKKPLHPPQSSDGRRDNRGVCVRSRGARGWTTTLNGRCRTLGQVNHAGVTNPWRATASLRRLYICIYTYTWARLFLLTIHDSQPIWPRVRSCTWHLTNSRVCVCVKRVGRGHIGGCVRIDFDQGFWLTVLARVLVLVVQPARLQQLLPASDRPDCLVVRLWNYCWVSLNNLILFYFYSFIYLFL